MVNGERTTRYLREYVRRVSIPTSGGHEWGRVNERDSDASGRYVREATLAENRYLRMSGERTFAEPVSVFREVYRNDYL